MIVRALFGVFLGLVARCLTLTCRIRVVTHPSLRGLGQVPWVYALWHGQMVQLLAHRRRRGTVALVSRSGDGELLCWAMRWFGVQATRGSTSRGAVGGGRGLLRSMERGWDVAIAVDGPRGPANVAQRGALVLARLAGAWVVPYAACCSRSVRLSTWDRLEVPLPFSRCVVALGEPIVPQRASVTDLGWSIGEAQRLAVRHLEMWGAAPQDEVSESERL